MKLFIALLLVLQTTALWAVRCEFEILSLAQKRTELQKLIQDIPDHPAATIFQKYQGLRVEYRNVLREDQVHNILLDHEFGWTARQLDEVLSKLERTRKSGTPEEQLEYVLRNHLKGKVPDDTIDARIAGYMDGGTMHRALGELTPDELGIVLHGGSPLAPTAKSRLGKLISSKKLKSVVRTFSKGPGYNGNGPEKLVIAFDNNSADEIKAFLDDIHMFGHYHTPNQGTLALFHKKNYFGWFNSGEINTSSISDDTMIIPVLLSSTEAQRMENFVDLYRMNSDIAERPWENSMRKYCSVGGYSSCTHWVGNIPIGDVKVPEYKLPGKVDGSAYNSLNPDPELDKLPRSNALKDYTLPKSMDPKHKRQIRMVWKVPGNEQLAYVLKLGKAQEGGMLANPGWVAHTFLSRLKEDRTPFIFVKRADASIDLPVDFDPKISPH